jgi:hypothetical protein
MFIAQVSEGSWRYPFIFTLPYFDKSKVVAPTDEEADATLDGMDAGTIVPAIMPAEVVTIHDEIGSQAGGKDSIKLDASLLKILTAVVECPMQLSSEYVKLAKVSPNTLSKARPVLIAKGLIAEHLSETTVRGRSARRWEPLDAAIQIVRKNEKGGD